MASAISLVPLAAQGQTWISAVDGSWSDISRWSTAPVSSATTALIFAPTGSQTYTAIDDFAGPFLLNALNLGGNSTGSITLGAGSLSSMRMIGVNPTITNNGLSPVTIQGRITIPASGLTLNLNAPNNSFASIGAVLSGTGGLAISSTGTGSVQLAARNTFSGNVTLSGALIDLPTQTSLGSGSLTVNNATLSTSNFVAPFGYGPVLPSFANNVAINAGGLKLGGNFGFTLAGNISGAGGVSLSPANLLSNTWTLAGSNTFTGSLTVNGPSGGVTNTLVINSPASLGNTPTINLSGAGARIGFVGGISTFTVNAPMTLTNGGAIAAINSTTNAKVVYAGKISGTGGLSILPGGSVTLTGANDFTGGLNLLGGTTAVNSFQNFGAASGTVTFSGGSLVLNPGFGVTSRKFNVAVSGSTLYNFDDVTFDGTFSNASSQGFTKAGAGNMLMTATSILSGPLLIAGGTITAGGNLGIVTSGVGSITIDAGAGLVLDNTAAAIQRVSSTGSIILSGGNLTVIGNGTQTSSTTVNTQFTVGSSVNESGAGFSVIDLQTTEDTATQVKFSTLSRGGNGGTQVLFTGARLGQVAVASPTAGATNFSFTTSPAGQLINGIFPWAIADSSGGIGTDFATYSVANGIQPLTTYSTDFTGGLTANVAVTSTTLSTGVASLASNSVKLSGGTINVAGGTLTIGSGAILAVNAPSAISGGRLVIGTGTTNTTTAPTANFFCNSDLTVSSNISNFDPGSGLPSGIAKSGPGVLLLSGSNSYSGPTFVLNGTLRLGSGTAIPSTSEVFINPGATLDLNGISITTGAINQTVGSFTIGNNNFGTISIGATTLTAGNDDNSSVFQGNITGSGNFVKQGAGTFAVIGSQAFTGTVTLAKGAMVLGTHATRGTAFASAARINIGTTATSADVVLAFDFGVENFSVPMSVQTNNSGRTATLKFLQSPNGTAGTNIASPITLNGATCGLIVDSSGGATLSGLISGAGSLMTQSTATSAAAGPQGFSINITGTNSYTGTTTLAAPVTLWGNASAFGGASSAIGLGNPNGAENPELSSSVGGLTLSRNITLNDSTDAVAAFGTIGSRAAAGSATTTYSGNISIAGQRSRLVIYSVGAPVAVIGLISGVQPTANVQIGATLGSGLEFTNSNVTLSSLNTYAGGTRLYCGTLNIGNSTVLAGQTITSGPLGTGTFFIGTAAAPGATEPTINAIGATRTIANPIVVSNNFTIGAQSPLILSGTVDLNAGARFVSVNGVATFSGAIVGAAGSAFVKDGVGTMQLSGSATHAGPTVVNSGTLAMLATQRLQGNLAIGPSASVTMKPGGATFLTVPALTIDAANAGSLDLADNDAVVDYAPASPSPLSSVATLIATGYASAAWTGPGITSSSAAAVAANVANTHKTAIGFAEASTFGIGTFAGQSVDNSAVLLRYTVVGDANIDGTVDSSDFNVMAANFNMTGALWQQGDFNFDGVVNALDFNNLSNNFGQTLPSPALGSLVPEPAMLLPLALATMLRRRRK